MQTQQIIDTILGYYPDTQAIYLFGSYGTEYERPESDIDLGLLLPHETAVQLPTLALTPVWHALRKSMGREIDLINLRLVSTVFQNEILNTARIILDSNRNARMVFEMQTLSAYQKLSEERKHILESFFETKRAYNV
ncbi:MAG TPA: nucleotidyltransferase domain-containing protein [Spirochaetota bacterium]|nr:nucleotidyltransferase domain-containing protein [Spirochaetota bacterium]HPN82432.1 nucleotidyltransferase domain-containing protein [Spirochaetota bacterium]